MILAALNKIRSNHIVVAIFVALGLWLLYSIRYVIALLLLSYIFAVALLPTVRLLERKKVPHSVAVIVPYGIIVGIIISSLYFLLPTVLNQSQELVQRLPETVSSIGQLFGPGWQGGRIRTYVESSVGSLVTSVGEGAIDTASITIDVLLSVVALFVLSVYLLHGYEDVKQKLAQLMEVPLRARVLAVVDEIEDKMGKWVRGQVIVSLIVGSMAWLVLTILGVPFATTLALIAGGLEFIPFLGPLLSIIPATIVGLSVSISTGIIVAGAYMVIQLIENNIIVPFVMKYSVELHPAIVIVAVLLGNELMGLVGAILAIPVSAIAHIVFRHIRAGHVPV